MTLEPDGKATGSNPVQVGSIPTGVSSEAMMHPGHLRPATGGVEDSRQSGHWATPEEPVPPPFWGLEGLAMWIAKVLFVMFLVLFIVSLLAGRRSYYPP